MVISLWLTWFKHSLSLNQKISSSPQSRSQSRAASRRRVSKAAVLESLESRTMLSVESLIDESSVDSIIDVNGPMEGEFVSSTDETFEHESVYDTLVQTNEGELYDTDSESNDVYLRRTFKSEDEIFDTEDDFYDLSLIDSVWQSEVESTDWSGEVESEVTTFGSDVDPISWAAFSTFSGAESETAGEGGTASEDYEAWLTQYETDLQSANAAYDASINLAYETWATSTDAAVHEFNEALTSGTGGMTTVTKFFSGESWTYDITSIKNDGTELAFSFDVRHELSLDAGEYPDTNPFILATQVLTEDYLASLNEQALPIDFAMADYGFELIPTDQGEVVPEITSLSIETLEETGFVEEEQSTLEMNTMLESELWWGGELPVYQPQEEFMQSIMPYVYQAGSSRLDLMSLYQIYKSYTSILSSTPEVSSDDAASENPTQAMFLNRLTDVLTALERQTAEQLSNFDRLMTDADNEYSTAQIAANEIFSQAMSEYLCVYLPLFPMFYSTLGSGGDGEVYYRDHTEVERNLSDDSSELNPILYFSMGGPSTSSENMSGATDQLLIGYGSRDSSASSMLSTDRLTVTSSGDSMTVALVWAWQRQQSGTELAWRYSTGQDTFNASTVGTLFAVSSAPLEHDVDPQYFASISDDVISLTSLVDQSGTFEFTMCDQSVDVAPADWHRASQSGRMADTWIILSSRSQVGHKHVIDVRQFVMPASGMGLASSPMLLVEMISVDDLVLSVENDGVWLTAENVVFVTVGTVVLTSLMHQQWKRRLQFAPVRQATRRAFAE